MAAAIFASMQREGRNSGTCSSPRFSEKKPGKPLLTLAQGRLPAGPRIWSCPRDWPWAGSFQECDSAGLPAPISLFPVPSAHSLTPKAGLTPLVSHQHRTASVKRVTVPLSAPVQVPPKQCGVLKTRGPNPGPAQGQGGQPRIPGSSEAGEQGLGIYANKSMPSNNFASVQFGASRHCKTQEGESYLSGEGLLPPVLLFPRPGLWRQTTPSSALRELKRNMKGSRTG